MKRAAAIACLIALSGFTSAAAGLPLRAATATGPAPCPATVPTRSVAPDAGFGPDGFNHGNRRLRAQLYWPKGVLRAGTLPDGGSYAVIKRDGSISAKVGWWVRDLAKLVIHGKRLDRPAPPLRASIGPTYDIGASLGFQPTGLTFPTVGCWRVVGRAGTARLTFVVKVTKLE